MQSINKKGLSSIVASVFFIFSVVVSIGIISASLFNTTLNLSPEISCSQMKINPPLVIENICSQDSRIELTLSRPITDSSNLDQFSISFNNEVFSCGHTCGGNCIIPNIGQTKTYNIQNPENSQSARLSISGCTLQEKEITSC